MIVYDHTHIKSRLNGTKMDFVYPHSHVGGLSKLRTMSHSAQLVESGRLRLKRQSRGLIGGNFCSMTLVADHTVYQQFGRSVGSVSRQLVSQVQVM